MTKKKSEALTHEKLTDLDAERTTIGALLRSPHEFWNICDKLKYSHFSLPLHRDVYSAFRDLMLEDKTISIDLLATRLPGVTDDGVGMRGFLATEYANAVDHSPQDFADKVIECASRRTLLTIANSLKLAVGKPESEVGAMAMEFEERIADLIYATSPQKPKHMSELVKTVMAEATEPNVMRGGFGWGLQSLDEIMGTILEGDLGFILASQGDGKTSLATQLGNHVSQERNVLMFQFEMKDTSIAAKELANEANVGLRQIQEGTLDFDQKEDLAAAAERLSARKFWIIDSPGMGIRTIHMHAKAFKRANGLGMIIVDQLDKIKSENRNHRDRFDKYTEATDGLKNMAKALNVPVVCLAQRTRGSQRRDSPTPGINDADAPTLERDADWVLAVWRRTSWLQQNKPNENAGGEARDKWDAEVRRARDTADVICLKHRRRSAFEKKTLKWIGERTTFAEL